MIAANTQLRCIRIKNESREEELKKLILSDNVLPKYEMVESLSEKSACFMENLR